MQQLQLRQRARLCCPYASACMDPLLRHFEQPPRSQSGPLLQLVDHSRQPKPQACRSNCHDASMGAAPSAAAAAPSAAAAPLAAAPAAPASAAGICTCRQIFRVPSPAWPPVAMSMQPTCCAASTASTVAQWPPPGASAFGRPRRIPTICKGCGWAVLACGADGWPRRHCLAACGPGGLRARVQASKLRLHGAGLPCWAPTSPLSQQAAHLLGVEVPKVHVPILAAAGHKLLGRVVQAVVHHEAGLRGGVERGSGDGGQCMCGTSAGRCAAVEGRAPRGQ